MLKLLDLHGRQSNLLCTNLEVYKCKLNGWYVLGVVCGEFVYAFWKLAFDEHYGYYSNDVVGD